MRVVSLTLVFLLRTLTRMSVSLMAWRMDDDLLDYIVPVADIQVACALNYHICAARETSGWLGTMRLLTFPSECTISYVDTLWVRGVFVLGGDVSSGWGAP